MEQQIKDLTNVQIDDEVVLKTTNSNYQTEFHFVVDKKTKNIFKSNSITLLLVSEMNDLRDNLNDNLIRNILKLSTRTQTKFFNGSFQYTINVNFRPEKYNWYVIKNLDHSSTSENSVKSGINSVQTFSPTTSSILPFIKRATDSVTQTNKSVRKGFGKLARYPGTRNITSLDMPTSPDDEQEIINPPASQYLPRSTTLKNPTTSFNSFRNLPSRGTSTLKSMCNSYNLANCFKTTTEAEKNKKAFYALTTRDSEEFVGGKTRKRNKRRIRRTLKRGHLQRYE